MNDNKLQNQLEQLRREATGLAGTNTAARDRLNLLINDIEKKLDRPEDEDHHHILVRGLKDTIRQFESDHPRATAILNEIMVTLGNMGI
jgi:hypothetical protein